MARIARVVVPHYPHHVTQRGVRRQRTFFSKRDYRVYIDLVARAKSKIDSEIWAYCLMPNHVHFVVVPKKPDGLSKLFQEAHRLYSQRVNFRHGWQGHLWQQRFESFPMDERHLMAAVKYVELNPVDAGLCESPEEWQWSSTNAHLQGRDDELVCVSPMLERVDDWRNYLSQEPDVDLDRIRLLSRTGRPGGDDEFVTALESLLGRRLRPRKRGRKGTKNK